MHHVHTCQGDHALARARWWMCTVGTGVRAADIDDDGLLDNGDGGDTVTIDPGDEQQQGHDNDRRLRLLHVWRLSSLRSAIHIEKNRTQVRAADGSIGG